MNGSPKRCKVRIKTPGSISWYDWFSQPCLGSIPRAVTDAYLQAFHDPQFAEAGQLVNGDGVIVESFARGDHQ